MHNISKKKVQDVAAELVELCIHADVETIFNKAIEVFEKSALLKYLEQTKEISAVKEEKQAPLTLFPEAVEPIQDKQTPVPQELSVEERIREIMKNAASYQPQTTIEKEVEKDDKPVSKLPQISKEEEMKETYSADFVADMFERADRIQTTKKSLNDKLSQEQIQVGLNDRIAFVKHLFNGSLEDFNRVLSQLNSFESESQVKGFLDKYVKTDYDWSDKEEYVKRFLQLVERKFL